MGWCFFAILNSKKILIFIFGIWIKESIHNVYLTIQNLEYPHMSKTFVMSNCSYISPLEFNKLKPTYMYTPIQQLCISIPYLWNSKVTKHINGMICGMNTKDGHAFQQC
jgi:hypothetical protein